MASVTRQRIDALIVRVSGRYDAPSIERMTADMIDWIIDCESNCLDFDEDCKDELKAFDFPAAARYVEKRFYGGLVEFIKMGDYTLN